MRTLEKSQYINYHFIPVTRFIFKLLYFYVTVFTFCANTISLKYNYFQTRNQPVCISAKTVLQDMILLIRLNWYLMRSQLNRTVFKNFYKRRKLQNVKSCNSCGDWTRTNDLRDMSPASFQLLPPRKMAEDLNFSRY